MLSKTWAWSIRAVGMWGWFEGALTGVLLSVDVEMSSHHARVNELGTQGSQVGMSMSVLNLGKGLLRVLTCVVRSLLMLLSRLVLIQSHGCREGEVSHRVEHGLVS